MLYGLGLLVLLGLLSVVLGALLYRSRLYCQINYNEGWNSAVVGRVLAGEALYPAPSVQLINNYPPLAFYMIAAVAKLTGSVLMAGRAVAWCGYAGCACLIGLILRRLDCTGAGSVFGALFFAAMLAVRCDLYVGMFDPQLPAQALMLTGLLVLLGRRGRWGAVAAAALVVAGGFVKHSLIALPIGVTLWLAWFRRDLFWAWLLAVLGFAGAGLLACATLFGPEFAHGLAVPRQLDPVEGVRKMLRWLLPVELPIALATLPLVWGGAAAGLVGLYLVAALAAGLLGAAPLATNYNMIFELLVAVSLGLGLAIGGPSTRLPGGWVALVAAASLVVTAAELATATTTSWRAWSAVQRAREAKALAEIEAIRAIPGPALCGTLLLCFEAGKRLEYDPLNYGQVPGEDQSGLRARIAAGEFGVIQIDYDNLYFSKSTLETIAKFYTEMPARPGLNIPLRDK
ncbi:MAG: hypothetical protein NVS2B11_01620 [Acetobacteraceae bacterium]